MAYASEREHRHDVPGEPGEWMTFRELGWAELENAREARQRRGSRALQDMGGDLYGAYLKYSENKVDGAQVVVDPINLHDRAVLLDAGVVAMSYTDLPPRRPEYREARLEKLGRITEETAVWAARMVLELGGVENAWGKDNEAIDAIATIVPNASRDSSYALTGS